MTKEDLFMSPKHQLTDQVKLLQKVAVIRPNQQSIGLNLEVLLLRRSAQAQSRPNCWDLPGGNSEWPVGTQASAANLHLLDLGREINEETGLSVDNSAFMLKLPVHLSTYFDREKQIYTVICGWLLNFAATDQSDIQISTEHQTYKWVSGVDLAKYDFGGDSGTFILDIIQKAFLEFEKNKRS